MTGQPRSLGPITWQQRTNLISYVKKDSAQWATLLRHFISCDSATQKPPFHFKLLLDIWGKNKQRKMTYYMTVASHWLRNTLRCHNSTQTHPLTPPPGSRAHTLTLQEHQVRRVIRSVNTRKVAGPKRIPGKVLQTCADMAHSRFNHFLIQFLIPPCLKSVVTIPAPKKEIKLA